MTEGRSSNYVDARRLASEYLTLNWRRLGGGVRLDPLERRRWRDLRDRLERLLGDLPPGSDGGSARSSLRVPSQLWVRYAAGGSEVTSEHCENLSEEGMFVASAQPLPPGTSLRLEIEGGPAMEPIKALGVVVWTRHFPQSGAPGMGVRFQGLGSEQRLALAGQLVSALVSI
jgi:uncharacterized protein (TIGR02266 family)